MYNYFFKIANIAFEIKSNLNLNSMLETPQPFGLHANYFLDYYTKSDINCKIIIEHRKGEEFSLSVFKDVLEIKGDLSPMNQDSYNPQFRVLGNRGVVNRYILHCLEKLGNNLILHACAVRNSSNKLCIGIGGSGSGKSAFVSNSLICGWELIASEHVIINEDLTIYKGNVYDNSSLIGAKYVESNLPELSIFKERKISEPTDAKILIDYSPKSIPEVSLCLKDYDMYVTLLCFGNNQFKLPRIIEDIDFLHRTFQINSSEKISFPFIFHNSILETNLNGAPTIRTKIYNTLLDNAHSKILLGGDSKDFQNLFITLDN